MINEITVRRVNEHTGNLWKAISLSSEYKIRKIDGLGPVKADINTLEIATEAGSEFMGARDGMRNILMVIEFNPNYAAGSTVTSLRRALYDVMMPGQRVELEFDVDPLGIDMPDMEDLPGQFNPLKIVGYVETHEPEIFSSNTSVAISIICPNPYFKTSWEQLSWTAPDVSEFAVANETHVTMGFQVEFTVTAGSGSGWSLTGRERNGYFGVAEPMVAGDKYFVSTVSGDRYVERERDNSRTSILGYMVGSLNDMKLYPGLNHFRFSNPGNSSSLKFRYNTFVGGL